MQDVTCLVIQPWTCHILISLFCGTCDWHFENIIFQYLFMVDIENFCRICIYSNVFLRILLTLRPGQNGRHFTDNIYTCIFFNENVWILLKISLKFIPKVRIHNIPALVQIIAWCRPGDKPLSEPMMVSLLTHICITRPQWVNSLVPGMWQ